MTTSHESRLAGQKGPRFHRSDRGLFQQQWFELSPYVGRLELPNVIQVRHFRSGISEKKDGSMNEMNKVRITLGSHREPTDDELVETLDAISLPLAGPEDFDPDRKSVV